MSRIEQIPISRFSLMTRLSMKALRIYDEKGLLVPRAKDNISGYRYYTIEQIAKGIKIKILKSLGFRISNIIQIFKAIENGDKNFIKILMENKLKETQKEIKRLQIIENVLLNRENSLELIYLNTTEPRIKEIPATRVVSRRVIGNYGEVIPKLIGEIMQQIYSPDNQRNMVNIIGPPMFCCHDEEFKEKDADIEVAVPISGRISVSPEFEIKNQPAIKVISLIFTGPYSGVSEVYNRGFEYLAKNNLKIAGPTRELYLNNPNDVPEEKLMTELQIPIQ